MKLTKNLRLIILAGALPFGMAAQQQTHRPDVAPSQNPGFQQSEANQMENPNSPDRPQSGPGFGAQIPNNASGQTPQTNSTLQQSRDADERWDLGWLGLLGIAGLFGLARPSQERTTTSDRKD